MLRGLILPSSLCQPFQTRLRHQHLKTFFPQSYFRIDTSEEERTQK